MQPTRRRPGWTARLAGAAVLVAALSGCSLPRFGAPDSASRQGDDILGLWKGTFVAALVVGAVVWALILYAVVRYRRRDDQVPSQNPYNVPLEILYTVVPVLIVAGLFFFTVRTERDVTDLAEEPDLVVQVLGFQWQWRFTYPDQGIVVTGEPGQPPELVVPVGETVRFELVANDVNHSFWVPDFLEKRDLIPGVDNEIDVVVTRAGVYDGRCAEYCGLDHWRMNFLVRAVDTAEFETWVATRRDVVP